MSGWYRAGTVTVTNGSTAVTGSGTAWIGSVQVGDAIRLPDGRAYEIAGIASDTALTLAQGYLGSSASGQAYAVQPTRGVLASLVAGVQALIAQVQGYVDGALAGRFGNGSAASPSVSFASDTDTGIWRIAANVLGIGTNGVERVRVGDATLQYMGSEVFRRANVLGTVSQSGGVPTGAIIQRGSNSNGEFVRFADGTQICWLFDLNLGSAAAAGAGTLADPYKTDVLTWTYPSSFVAEPAGQVTIRATMSDGRARGLAGMFRTYAGSGNGGTMSSIAAYRIGSQANAENVFAQVTAVGRWF